MGHLQRKESCNSCQRWRMVSSNDGTVRRKRNRLLFFLAVVPCLASGGMEEAATSFDEPPLSLRGGNPKSSSWYHRLPRIFAGDAETLQEQEQNDDKERWLKSSSSDGGGGRGDDYYHYYDDAYKFRDDDFYKYLGDPLDPKLFPMTRRDVIGFMLASIGVLLGSSGGIGGGGLVIPIFIIVNGLSPRYAIPLGSVTVFGGSLAGLLLNLRRRHPLADRPIIDWDLILVMEPVVLVGALIGGILHRVVSEKILTVLLVLLLSVVAHTTLAKAKRMYDAETRYIEHLKQARADQIARICSFRSNFRQSGAWSAQAVPEDDLGMSKTDPSFKMCSPPTSPGSVRPTRTGSIDDSVDADERQRILILNPDFVTLRSDLLEQEKATPRSKVMVLSIKFTVIMFMNLMLGGGAFKSPWGIMCGSVAYWVVHVIMVAFLIASAWAAQTYLVNRHEIKEIVCYDFVHGDIRWEPKTAVIYPSLFLGAGLCAGMLGIGGGMVCVPILLSMGVHPAVVAATSSTMVFFTAALSTSSFAVFNLILWDYALVCIFIGFLASLFGQGLMSRAKRQSKTAGANFERNSFIAYCIGGVVLLSALLMTIQYVLEIVSYDANASKSAGSGLCEGFRISQ